MLFFLIIQIFYDFYLLYYFPTLDYIVKKEDSQNLYKEILYKFKFILLYFDYFLKIEIGTKFIKIDITIQINTFLALLCINSKNILQFPLVK